MERCSAEIRSTYTRSAGALRCALAAAETDVIIGRGGRRSSSGRCGIERAAGTCAPARRVARRAPRPARGRHEDRSLAARARENLRPPRPHVAAGRGRRRPGQQSGHAAAAAAASACDAAAGRPLGLARERLVVAHSASVRNGRWGCAALCRRGLWLDAGGGPRGGASSFQPAPKTLLSSLHAHPQFEHPLQQRGWWGEAQLSIETLSCGCCRRPQPHVTAHTLVEPA